MFRLPELQGARHTVDKDMRIKQLEHQLGLLEARMEKHLTKEEVIPDDRLASLTKRIQHYEDQLEDLRSGQDL